MEAAIKRAATIGDGWLVVPIPTLDQLAKQMSIYQSARSAARLPPSPHVCRLLEVGCAPDDDTALRRIAPFLMEKYKAYFSWGLEGLTLDPNATPEQQFRGLASNRFAVGAPPKVIDMLLAQHRAGITHLSMRVSWPGMGQDDILAGIELLGRQVLPRGAAPDLCRLGAASAHAAAKSKASRQRTTRPVDGEGKWAVHMSVEVSQKRPNSSRRDIPACLES